MTSRVLEVSSAMAAAAAVGLAATRQRLRNVATDQTQATAKARSRREACTLLCCSRPPSAAFTSTWLSNLINVTDATVRHRDHAPSANLKQVGQKPANIRCGLALAFLFQGAGAAIHRALWGPKHSLLQRVTPRLSRRCALTVRRL